MAFDVGRGDSAVPMTEQEIIERYAFIRTVKENCVEQMLLPSGLPPARTGFYVQRGTIWRRIGNVISDSTTRL